MAIFSNAGLLMTQPDPSQGIPAADIVEGTPYHTELDGEPVVLVRLGDEIHAIGGHCTHYHGPLWEGLITGDQIRCPWHHACFSVRTGQVTAEPALAPLPTWDVELLGDRVYIRGQRPTQTDAEKVDATDTTLQDIVIIGVGAAGNVAAETLRAHGYAGRLVIVDADRDAPYDRPNLSKDYLAGTAEEAWLPLRGEDWEKERDIRRIHELATDVDVVRRKVQTESGLLIDFDALLLATGGAPIRPPIPGADLPHVHVLRSLADCRALIADAAPGKHFLIAGASFIGMEAAASLRSRDVRVTVVAPEAVPFSKTLGEELGLFLKEQHEKKGVTFRLGHTVAGITRQSVTLDTGEEIAADAVLLGIGVRPRLDLAQRAGLKIDHGVIVNEFLQSSVPGIYAAGDIARYPDPHTGEPTRIEHWVVAERQGRVAAMNMLGMRVPFTSVPFFWTTQFDTTINYVGHATKWTDIRTDGSPSSGSYAASYIEGSDVRAFVTIGRDQDSLTTEHTMEAGTA